MQVASHLLSISQSPIRLVHQAIDCLSINMETLTIAPWRDKHSRTTHMAPTLLKISNYMEVCMRARPKVLKLSNWHQWLPTRGRMWTTEDTSGHITPWFLKYCRIRRRFINETKRSRWSSSSAGQRNLSPGGLLTIRKKSLALSRWIDIITLRRMQEQMMKKLPASASRHTIRMSILTKANRMCHFLALTRSTSCKRWRSKLHHSSWESPRSTSNSLQKWINS